MLTARLSPLRSAGSRVLTVCAALHLLAPVLHAADKWTEIKSPHFTVLANGSIGEARTLTWQLEQIRSALVSILPWAKVELDGPFVVWAVDSEAKMRALAPEYWERGSDVKPVSVWNTGADRHYLAIRSDVQAEDRRDINPHVNAYFSYVSVVIRRSLERPMPLWFTRGLAGVLSNTIVFDSFLHVGPPIPWHLQYLRERERLPLATLVNITPDSREFTEGEGLRRFDAQAWAFVHFLMFGNKGVRASQINEYFRLVTGGTPPDVAMTQTFGKVDALDNDLVVYVNQSIFTFAKLNADAAVKREGFASRTMSAVEAGSALALFHTGMRRPVEARAAIAEARKGGAAAPETYLAEALLLRREEKDDEAREALARGAAMGSVNALTYLELVRLQWRSDATRAALAEREKLLARAIELNPRDPWTLSMLAETRSGLGAVDALEMVARAIKLDPSESAHRLAAARILWRAGSPADALKAIDAALVLAVDDDARRRAHELRQAIERAKPQPH